MNAGISAAAVHTIVRSRRSSATTPDRRPQTLNPNQTIRLAVVDTDSGFVTVLSKRAEAAGWQLRHAAGAVPPEELVAMKLNAVLIDPAILGDEGWEYLERVCGCCPTSA